MASDFIIGQTYNRRRDIHARFGGQRQSGIVTPAKYPAVFIFTGRGARHGYTDEWSPDSTFRYFGEGQTGDMAGQSGERSRELLGRPQFVTRTPRYANYAS